MNETCSFRSRLDAFLDGELSPSERAAFETHLQSCPSCASEAVFRMKLRETTRLAGQRYTPDPRLLGRIAAPRAARFRPMRFLPLAAAAAIALAAGLSYLAVQRANHERAFSELLDLHAANLASASRVEIASSDRHVVKPWFQGRVPFSVSLPDQMPEPFHLLGGRVTFLDQLPAAHLLFQVRLHDVSVFVLQDRPEARRLFGEGARTERTYHVKSWSAGGLHWVAVGEVPAAELEQLCDALGG